MLISNYSKSGGFCLKVLFTDFIIHVFNVEFLPFHSNLLSEECFQDHFHLFVTLLYNIYQFIVVFFQIFNNFLIVFCTWNNHVIVKMVNVIAEIGETFI